MDRTGKRCSSCKEGLYKETSLQDDWSGVLHCTNCGKQVDRYSKREIKKEAPEEETEQASPDDETAEKIAQASYNLVSFLSEREAKKFLLKYYVLRPSHSSYLDVQRLSRELAIFVFKKNGWDTSALEALDETK